MVQHCCLHFQSMCVTVLYQTDIFQYACEIACFQKRGWYYYFSISLTFSFNFCLEQWLKIRSRTNASILKLQPGHCWQCSIEKIVFPFPLVLSSWVHRIVSLHTTAAHKQWQGETSVATSASAFHYAISSYPSFLRSHSTNASRSDAVSVTVQSLKEASVQGQTSDKITLYRSGMCTAICLIIPLLSWLCYSFHP